MEPYKTFAESRPCRCGGKCALTPSLKAKHEATRKHRTWRWQLLCEASLREDVNKRLIFREMKDLVAFVK